MSGDLLSLLDSNITSKPAVPAFQNDENLLSKFERAADQGLLLDITEDHYPVLSMEDFQSKRVAILGSPGSGKSNTFARIFEQIFKNSQNGAYSCGGTIVDLEGEFWSLASEVSMLKIGKAPYCDMEVDPQGAPAIATKAFEDKLLVLLDFSNHINRYERCEFMTRYFQKLFEISNGRKQVHFIGIDEAKEYFPEHREFDHNSQRDLANVMEQIATRGRKRGLSLILSTQRPATISKEILATCTMQVLHNIMDPTDFKAYRDRVGDALGRNLRNTIEGMKTGDALIFTRSDDNSGAKWYKGRILRRDSFDVGYTPTVQEGDVLPDPSSLLQIQEELIKEIKLEVSAYDDPKAAAEKRYLSAERQLIDVENQLRSERNLTKELRERIDILSTLSAKVDGYDISSKIADGIAIGFSKAIKLLNDNSIPEEEILELEDLYEDAESSILDNETDGEELLAGTI